MVSLIRIWRSRPVRVRALQVALGALTLLPLAPPLAAPFELRSAARAVQAAPARQLAAPLPHTPAVLAKSAMVMDRDNGAVLFQKFPDAQLPMASTTKIMTGLLTAESGRLDEVATVSHAAAVIGESTMGLVEGERVSLRDLLYGLMLPSGNDAAVVIAEHLAGSVPAFAEMMNARAASLGLQHTHYVNPHGLDHAFYYSPQHYSSARDLAVLATTAMANDTFAQVVGTTMRDVPGGAPGQPVHHLRNLLSQLWWYPGVKGGKTGWTDRAGQVRVVAAERGGERLVAVVMDSPDEVGETRDLLDYGFAAGGRIDQASLTLTPDGFPLPEQRLTQAWNRYKQLALSADGRIRTGAAGDEATIEAQAKALLNAVWLRDRATFDLVWGWTKASLSRKTPAPGNAYRDALFASRWARGSIADWSNATPGDERAAAALLLASKLWNEPSYAEQAKPILDALLNKDAISWEGRLGIPAANSSLKELDPVTTSAASMTPAFYRMFAEADRNTGWLVLLDGSYATIAQAMASDGPLGAGAGLLPSWYSVTKDQGQVGTPIDPSWQSTGFGETSPALVFQLALDARWSGDPRARAVLTPTAQVLARDLAAQKRIAAAYTRAGTPATSAETSAYGMLAGIVAADSSAEAVMRTKLEAALASSDADRVLDALDGLWMLAGGPPNYWRIWWPPADLPTTRNDAVAPPDDGHPWRYFSETGHVAQGRFLSYFEQHGGLALLGYARTEEMVEDGRLVQYFQRGRLEYFPEREGTGTEVALAPLGRRYAQTHGLLRRPEAQPIAPFESDDTHLYVPETGHSVANGFLEYYAKAGGVAVLGNPITQELNDAGFTDQYFERGALEYLPGKPVQALLLGDDLLAEKGWLK